MFLPWKTSRSAPRCLAATGMRLATAACNATSARANASCMRARGDSASSGRATATGSCLRPTGGRRASASIPSRRSRSTTSCPGRPCFPSAPPAATSPASSARTGTSRRPAPTTGCSSMLRRKRSRGPRSRAARDRLPSPITTLSSSSNMPSTSPPHAGRLGVKTVAVTAGYIGEGARPEFFAGHGRRQYRPQGLHRGFLSQALHRLARRRARHASLRQARDQDVARDHHAPDPGRERFISRGWRSQRMGHGSARAGRAAPLHRVPSRLEDARQAADAAFDPDAGASHRARRRPSLRLYRQRA